jgi:hypothetical protein
MTLTKTSKQPNVRKKAIKKTYTVAADDLEIIKVIKDRLLNHKCVVTDSQVIRMGLTALTSYKETDLVKLAQEVPTLTKKSKY